LPDWGDGDINWWITGVDDFNGDGKADLLWRNYSTGRNAIWSAKRGRSSREGFAAVAVQLRVGSRPPAPLRIRLKLERVRQEITVQGEADTVSTEAGENRDAVSLDRNMLDNLPVFDQDYVPAM
jgi:hypothetical protein